MSTYQIELSMLQVEILQDTVESFVDNHKLLHMPDQTGEIVGLPLTASALQFIHAVLKEKEETGKVSVEVKLESREGESEVKVSLLGTDMTYQVDWNSFDPV